MNNEDKVYKCLLKNETDQDIEFYPNQAPTNRKRILPGEKVTWESKEEREVFSPYTQIKWVAKYSAAGKEIIVKLRKRPHFSIKWEKNEFPCEWLNLGAMQFEMDRCKKSELSF